eukprot:COSAG06_NODE_49895_length_322_cov_0.928251_1_plen_48_part_01
MVKSEKAADVNQNVKKMYVKKLLLQFILNRSRHLACKAYDGGAAATNF